MPKTKSILQLWPLPCIFDLFEVKNGPSMGSNSHPYIFGISGTRRMGKHTELISKLTFDFFVHPCDGGEGRWWWGDGGGDGGNRNPTCPPSLSQGEGVDFIQN